MSEESLKKFGRYLLLDRIAQGGMAEIFRARMNSAQGAGRVVVIKRIITAQGDNEEFKKMFDDELNLTANFNHPNVIQLYDWGIEKTQPYISMEYIDGKNIRQVGNKFIEKGQKIPIDLAVFLIEQSALGLNYAHAFKNKLTGEAFNVVHRDISPQNILVAFEGSVKVIDFGVAKATTNGEATKAGVIKGKLSYLSPEQIACEILDGRSDLFALGIVCWELLTAKKLFSAPGENEYAVLKQIENCDAHIKPPSTFNPEVPKELDDIVMKALAKNRDYRYANCGEFAKALRKFLNGVAPDFDQNVLSVTMKDMFKDQIVEDRKTLQRLSNKADTLISMQGNEPQEPTQSGGQPVDIVTRRIVERSPDIVLTAEEKSMPKIEIANTKSQSRPQGTRPGMPPSGDRTRSIARPPKSEPLAPRGTHDESSGGGIKFVLVLIAAGVAAFVFGPQFGFDIQKMIQGKTKSFPQSAQVAESQGKSRSTAALEGKQISLRLKIIPNVGQDTQIRINNQTTGQIVNTVSLDEPLEIEVERPGFQRFRRELVLSSKDYDGKTEAELNVQLDPLSFGLVTIHTTPAATAIIKPLDPSNRAVASIDGKDWVEGTPFEGKKFPVGTYQIKFVNELLGFEKTEVINVQQDKTVRLDVNLSTR
ncbi:MAG: serine/threonine protein kinase [Xanthomonadaceae bacterium]|nr:serine/threonine protein kinase [Xanthomonadaceae bacterium]